MKYTFTFTINIITILKTYFIGFVIAYFLALFFILNTNQKRKKHFIFINKAIIVYSFMSWFFIINYIFFRISLLNKKMTKECFLYRRFKDIFKGINKKESLYLYCNNKYFSRVKDKLNKKNRKKIIYRIFKGEIKVDNYSKESFENYVKPLTLENYEGLFDFEERDNLEANYELLVFERFCKIYL